MTLSYRLLAIVLILAPCAAMAQSDPLAGSIGAFEIEDSDITLSRLAQPDTYFDKTGRRFAVLGTESGTFEAWAYPIKLFRNFAFSFFIGSGTEPIHARDIVSSIDVRPAATTITYVFQSFTVRAHYVTAVYDPGALILLDVDSTEPLTIVAGFIPVLNPMWPAGIGGQYAYWDSDRRAFLISESSRFNHGYLGSPSAQGLSYTPAHMLSDQPSQFSIRIEDPSSTRNRFIPVVMAGGTGDRETVQTVYEKLLRDPEAIYRESIDHFDSLRARTMRIRTPERRLDLALEWAKVAYDNLLVSNPQFSGTGLVAGLDRSGQGGRPGFGWFFGGDTYINSLSLNALGDFQAVRDAVSFMTQFQRDDGKMAHEVTQATRYLDWFADYPYAYIHADTSPFFISAVNDYYQATGDLEFVRSQWSALVKAYEWSRATDGDGDGLMDNSLAGLGALEFGALTGIQSDIYLNAAWIRATESMTALATAMRENDVAEQTRADHAKANAAFEKYWSEKKRQYVYAFNADGKLVEEITPWSAVALMFNYGTDERAASSLLRMAESDLTSDWGVRMLSTDSDYFEPLNYNYGAVWPFLTSWVTTAQFRRGLPLQGYSGLMSTIQHVFNRSLGQVTEVFSGTRHTWPQESVPHQGFCTAGTVLPLVRGLMGLTTDFGASQLAFRPAFPGDWQSVQVDNYRIGTGGVDISFERHPELLRVVFDSRVDFPLELVFEPFLAPGTTVSAVHVNGRPASYELRDTGFTLQPSIGTTLHKMTTIELNLVPAFEIIPPTWNSRVGDASHGIRINRYKREANAATLIVEGLPDKVYELPVLHADRIQSIDGAIIENDMLILEIPSGAPESYVRRTIRFKFIH